MLALMGYVARGVDIPEKHLKEGRAPEPVSAQGADSLPLVPLRVYSREDVPEDAFVAIRYQQHWFYLKHSDHQSKTAFGLLTYLFQIQAPAPQGAGPLLTLPAGGGG